MKNDTNFSIMNNKGITLVALVVTIIVLIILAGISINLIIGENGIITKAKEAKQLEEVEGLKEKIRMEIVAVEIEKIEAGNKITQSEIEEILKKYGTVNKNADGTIKSLTPTGKEYEILFEEIYKGTVENTNKQYLADKVSVGEYVAYDATNNYSYTSEIGTGSSHGNGYTAQTFTSSSSLKWRVLSTNPTTKEVVLISENPIDSDTGRWSGFSVKGAIGYLYAEQELNEICKIYGYGKGANTSKVFKYETGDLVEGTTKGRITGSGARSINVDDINKITGVTPSEAVFTNYGKQYTSTRLYPTTETSTGISESTATRTETYTRYSYLGSNYLSGTMYDILFGTNNYWLASRALYVISDYSDYTVRAMYDNQLWYCDNTFFHISTTYGVDEDVSESYGIRPIVYLKPTVETNGKDENGAWTIID